MAGPFQIQTANKWGKTANKYPGTANKSGKTANKSNWRLSFKSIAVNPPLLTNSSPPIRCIIEKYASYLQEIHSKISNI